MNRKFAYFVFILASYALWNAPARAQYVACTSIPSVQVSHFVTHNNQYGGHLNDHVFGQTPPPGQTQAGKTIFRDWQEWEDAFTWLANQEPALQCNTNAPIGSEAARTLPLQYFSFQCTAANHLGQCTHGNQVQTNHVIFVMRVVPNGAGGSRWILYTAYPTPH